MFFRGICFCTSAGRLANWLSLLYAADKYYVETLHLRALKIERLSYVFKNFAACRQHTFANSDKLSQSAVVPSAYGRSRLLKNVRESCNMNPCNLWE